MDSLFIKRYYLFYEHALKRFALYFQSGHQR